MNYVKNMLSKGVGASAILSGLIPLLAHGQPSTVLPGISSNTTVDTFITTVLCVIATYMFWILVALTVVFTIIAAYKYLFSGGEPAKVSSATKTITFAAASIAIALLAKGLPFIVASIVLSGPLPTAGPVCP